MSGLPWFRLYADFAKHPTVQSLAFEDQRHFVVLMCLKCDGTLDKNFPIQTRERVIYRALGLDPVAANEAKRRLMEVGLITKDWQIPKWNERQFKSDSSTERVRKYRKTKKTGNVSSPLQKRSRSVSETEMKRPQSTDTDTDTDTEISSLRSDISSAKTAEALPAKINGVPYGEVLSLYNEIAADLPKALKLTDKRKRHIAKLYQSDLPTLESWRRFFHIVAESDFLNGRMTGRNWRASFEWIITPDNALKIAEGKYDNLRRSNEF